MIRLACYETDSLAKEYLSTLLERDHEIRVQFHDARCLTRLPCPLPPDIDVAMLPFELDGALRVLYSVALPMLRALPASTGRVPVLALTSEPSPAMAAVLRSLGAQGMVGRGETAEMLVPAVCALATGREWWPIGPASSARGDGPSVLVAETDRATRSVWSEVLSGMGRQVAYAYTTDDARELLSGRPFELLALNSRLPGRIRGVELLAQIEVEYPWLPVIIHGENQYSVWDDRPSPNVRAFTSPPLTCDRVAEAVGACL